MSPEDIEHTSAASGCGFDDGRDGKRPLAVDVEEKWGESSGDYIDGFREGARERSGAGPE